MAGRVFRPRWSAVFRSQIVLVASVVRWRLGDAVPADMARVLRTARRLLLLSWIDYEFGLVAGTWSLLALEAGLRACLEVPDEKTDLGTLLALARSRGLITKDEFKALDGARTLRNMIVHGGLVPSFPRAVAVEMVTAIGDAVSDLYQRAVDGRGGCSGPAHG